MEENKPKEEFSEEIKVPTTFISVEHLEGIGCRYTTGKTLRRDYIYKKRDEYVLEHKRIPTPDEMEVFAIQARKLYMQEGDYKVVGEEATWLGNY